MSFLSFLVVPLFVVNDPNIIEGFSDIRVFVAKTLCSNLENFEMLLEACLEVSLKPFQYSTGIEIISKPGMVLRKISLADAM